MDTVDNVIYASGRFFIDIAKSGCGSACTYCYVKGAHEKQILIDEYNLDKSLKHVLNSPNFFKGRQGSIISLCPNTEPFKSKKSADLIQFILEFFLPLGNPLQISTKETIPVDILEQAQHLSVFEKQVYFNISTSCISKAHIIEPHASTINKRFENFNRIKAYDKLTSCIYIKPFSNNTFIDLDRYVESINIHAPDFACVGIDFKKTTILEKPCDLLYHSKSIVEKAFNSDVESKITYFRKEIERNTLTPVFHSSTCIISKLINITANPNIKSVAPGLCVECNSCNH